MKKDSVFKYMLQTVTTHAHTSRSPCGPQKWRQVCKYADISNGKEGDGYICLLHISLPAKSSSTIDCKEEHQVTCNYNIRSDTINDLHLLYLRLVDMRYLVLSEIFFLKRFTTHDIARYLKAARLVLQTCKECILHVIAGLISTDGWAPV